MEYRGFEVTVTVGLDPGRIGFAEIFCQGVPRNGRGPTIRAKKPYAIPRDEVTAEVSRERIRPEMEEAVFAVFRLIDLLLEKESCRNN